MSSQPDQFQENSVYGTNPWDQMERRHALSVLVDNEPGVLARVIGLLSGRGYNIESLAVSEVSKELNQSRMTIVTQGTVAVIAQIKLQLERLVPVHSVNDLTDEGLHIERELALVKVSGEGDKRIEALRTADIFRAHVVDSTMDSFIFEITGSTEKVDAFIDLMKPLGMANISRTGVVALLRGNRKI